MDRLKANITSSGDLRMFLDNDNAVYKLTHPIGKVLDTRKING
jgi:hypothetical protein